MKDRIAKIIKEENLSAKDFANEIGISASAVSHILNGTRTNISLEVINKILDRFRYINAEWLIGGRGEFRKGFSNNQDKKSDLSHKNSIEPPHELEKIEDKIKNISRIQSNSINQQEIKSARRTVKQVIVFYTDNTYDIFNK